MRRKKIIWVTIVIALTVVITVFIYFVVGVSSTYPPIKEYEYSGTTDQLTKSISRYVLVNSDMKFKITDVTGKKNDYATYVTIEQSNVEYNLKCEERDLKAKARKTIISLVGVYDKTRNFGGYSKDAKGIGVLVNKFEGSVLKTLRDNQNIQIDPM